MVCFNNKLPDFDSCIVIMEENVIVLRKYILKYKGQRDVLFLFSNDSEKKYINSFRMLELTTGEFGYIYRISMYYFLCLELYKN